MKKNKKIKICFFSLQAYPLFDPEIKDNFGGAELQTFFLSTALAKDQHFKVSAVVGNYNQKNIEKCQNVILYKLNNKFRTNIKLFKDVIFTIRMYHILKKIDADIYHQRALGITTVLIALFCKVFGKKFIYMTACEEEVQKKEKMESNINPFWRRGLLRANVVLTQNAEHKKLLWKNFHKKSEVFKNIFPIPQQKNIENKKTILWVGSSQPLKRPEIFLKIAKNFPHEQFEMVMPKHIQNENFYKKIYKDAQKLSNLKLFEKVPFEEINDFFARAKIFVNTSTVEGFPNTFIQAALNSTTIVSLNVNPDNFLNQYNCGFFSQNNFDLLNRQINNLIKDKKLWQNMSINAYNYAIKNHDIKKGVAKYKKIVFALKET